MSKMEIVSIIYYIETVIRNNWYRLVGKMVKLYLILHGCRVGKGLKCKAWPRFKAVPKGNITIGNYVTLGRDITLEAWESGKIVLGNHVLLTQNVLISSKSEVRMGDYSGAAEYTSIRDHDHEMKNKNLAIRQEPSRTAPIFIGEKVGITSYCLILRGAVLPNGVILGANTIVTREDKLEENGIYVGSPPKLIRKRA